MSAAFALSPDFSSSDSSEHEIVLTHPCHWGWCRELLPTKEELKEHLMEHTRRVVPVRRKDIALLRRIEEGTQQSRSSTKISLLKDLVSGPASTSHQHIGTSQEVYNRPAPSPPHSNTMLHSPRSELRSSRHVTPTFASLNSPANSQASQVSRTVPIPDSPPFSSLINRKSHVQQLSQINPRPSLQSRSSTGSTGSQMSVEKQLTQSPRSDVAPEVNPSPHHKNAMNDIFSQSGLDGDITMSQNLYVAEQAWDSSEKTENVFLSHQPSHAGELELLTQPPSQLQLGTFPFHNHRKSRNISTSQAEPTSSMPFRPSPPVPVTEQTFAASTPRPQPVRRQTRSQSRGPEHSPIPTNKQSTPARRTTSAKPASTPKTPKSAQPRSRSFRSGTLQITPLPQPKPFTITEETSQQLQQGLTAEELLDMHNPLHHFNGSPRRSQSSFESMDFTELQTQAPYESQPMTQY